MFSGDHLSSGSTSGVDFFDNTGRKELCSLYNEINVQKPKEQGENIGDPETDEIVKDIMQQSSFERLKNLIPKDTPLYKSLLQQNFSLTKLSADNIEDISFGSDGSMLLGDEVLLNIVKSDWVGFSTVDKNIILGHVKNILYEFVIRFPDVRTRLSIGSLLNIEGIRNKKGRSVEENVKYHRILYSIAQNIIQQHQKDLKTGNLDIETLNIYPLNTDKQRQDVMKAVFAIQGSEDIMENWYPECKIVRFLDKKYKEGKSNFSTYQNSFWYTIYQGYVLSFIASRGLLKKDGGTIVLDMQKIFGDQYNSVTFFDTFGALDILQKRLRKLGNAGKILLNTGLGYDFLMRNIGFYKDKEDTNCHNIEMYENEFNSSIQENDKKIQEILQKQKDIENFIQDDDDLKKITQKGFVSLTKREWDRKKIDVFRQCPSCREYLRIEYPENNKEGVQYDTVKIKIDNEKIQKDIYRCRKKQDIAFINYITYLADQGVSSFHYPTTIIRDGKQEEILFDYLSACKRGETLSVSPFTNNKLDFSKRDADDILREKRTEKVSDWFSVFGNNIKQGNIRAISEDLVDITGVMAGGFGAGVVTVGTDGYGAVVAGSVFTAIDNVVRGVGYGVIEALDVSRPGGFFVGFAQGINILEVQNMDVYGNTSYVNSSGNVEYKSGTHIATEKFMELGSGIVLFGPLGRLGRVAERSLIANMIHTTERSWVLKGTAKMGGFLTEVGGFTGFNMFYGPLTSSVLTFVDTGDISQGFDDFSLRLSESFEAGNMIVHFLDTMQFIASLKVGGILSGPLRNFVHQSQISALSKKQMSLLKEIDDIMKNKGWKFENGSFVDSQNIPVDRISFSHTLGEKLQSLLEINKLLINQLHMGYVRMSKFVKENTEVREYFEFLNENNLNYLEYGISPREILQKRIEICEKKGDNDLARMHKDLLSKYDELQKKYDICLVKSVVYENSNDHENVSLDAGKEKRTEEVKIGDQAIEKKEKEGDKKEGEGIADVNTHKEKAKDVFGMGNYKEGDFRQYLHTNGFVDILTFLDTNYSEWNYKGDFLRVIYFSSRDKTQAEANRYIEEINSFFRSYGKKLGADFMNLFESVRPYNREYDLLKNVRNILLFGQMYGVRNCKIFIHFAMKYADNILSVFEDIMPKVEHFWLHFSGILPSFLLVLHKFNYTDLMSFLNFGRYEFMISFLTQDGINNNTKYQEICLDICTHKNADISFLLYTGKYFTNSFFSFVDKNHNSIVNGDSSDVKLDFLQRFRGNMGNKRLLRTIRSILKSNETYLDNDKKFGKIFLSGVVWHMKYSKKNTGRYIEKYLENKRIGLEHSDKRTNMMNILNKEARDNNIFIDEAMNYINDMCQILDSLDLSRGDQQAYSAIQKAIHGGASTFDVKTLKKTIFKLGVLYEKYYEKEMFQKMVHDKFRELFDGEGSNHKDEFNTLFNDEGFVLGCKMLLDKKKSSDRKDDIRELLYNYVATEMPEYKGKSNYIGMRFQDSADNHGYYVSLSKNQKKVRDSENKKQYSVEGKYGVMKEVMKMSLRDYVNELRVILIQEGYLNNKESGQNKDIINLGEAKLQELQEKKNNDNITIEEMFFIQKLDVLLKNIKYISDLQKEFIKKYETDKSIYIHIEQDPIKTLQMGEVIDGSCTSFHNPNSYYESCITTAIDKNKKVLYITDSEGNILGRSLIVIDDYGSIVVFPIYYKGERIIDFTSYIKNYVQDLANKMNLKISRIIYPDDLSSSGIIYLDSPLFISGDN